MMYINYMYDVMSNSSMGGSNKWQVMFDGHYGAERNEFYRPKIVGACCKSSSVFITALAIVST